MKNLIIVRVNPAYCDYLRKFDDKVYFNNNSKETRPYIGVLFSIGDMKYFAPLSSPKPKHLTMKSAMDFIKIDDGKLGVINLNNMIPIKDDCYQIVDLVNLPKNVEEQEYFYLLNDQYYWMVKHQVKIAKKSLRLYNWYNNDKLPINIKNRCCDFKLLESKCMEYNFVNV